MSNLTLEHLLQQFLQSTDNNARRDVEATILQGLKTEGGVRNLVDITFNTQLNVGIRQFAAVLLRKRVMFFWRFASFEEQNQFKAQLATCFSAEGNRAVRLSLAHIVSTVYAAADGDWPELDQYLKTIGSQPNPYDREMTMICVRSILERTNSSSPSLMAALAVGLGDQESNIVKEAALRGLVTALPALKGHVYNFAESYKKVINDIFGSITTIRSSDDLGVALRGMDVLDALMELLHTKSDSELITTVATFLLGRLQDTSAPCRIREYSAEILGQLVESKKKFIKNSGLITTIVMACMMCFCEAVPLASEKEQESDDNDTESMDYRASPPSYAGSLLSELAMNLPEKVVAPLVLSFVKEAQDGPTKKASILAIAAIAEGCSKSLRKVLPQIVQETLDCIAASGDELRQEAGVFAVASLCEFLKPEVELHVTVFMRQLVPMLASDSERIRKMAARSVECACISSGPTISDIVPQLLPALVGALPRCNTEGQSNICRAIAAVGEAAPDAFRPFGEDVLKLLMQPLNDSTVGWELQASAIEAAGVTATCVGSERFAPFFEFYVNQAVAGMASESSELNEDCFTFCANITPTLGSSLIPYVPRIIEAVRKSIENDNASYDNQHPLKDTSPFAMDGTEGADEEGFSMAMGADANNAASAPTDIHMKVSLAELHEKKAAVYLLGSLAFCLRGSFGEYAQGAYDFIRVQCEHYFPGLASNALVALARCAIAVDGREHVDKVNYDPNMPNPNIACLNDVLNELFDVMVNRRDKSLVQAACQAFAELVQFYGPSMGIDFSIPMQILQSLLKRETACQVLADGEDAVYPDEEGADVDDEEERDFALIEAVCETIETVAKELKEVFGSTYFAPTLEALRPYFNPKRPLSDLVAATGVTAAIIPFLGAAANPFYGQLLDVAFTLIKKSDESSVKSNGCFLIRNLVETCSSQVTPEHLTEIMSALWSVAQANEEMPFARDNSIAAACVAARVFPQFFASSSGALDAVLSGLPLRADRGENPACVRMLVYLLHEGASVGSFPGGCTPESLGNAITNMLISTNDVDEATRFELHQALGAFLNARPQAIESMGSALRQHVAQNSN